MLFLYRLIVIKPINTHFYFFWLSFFFFFDINRFCETSRTFFTAIFLDQNKKNTSPNFSSSSSSSYAAVARRVLQYVCREGKSSKKKKRKVVWFFGTMCYDMFNDCRKLDVQELFISFTLSYWLKYVVDDLKWC